MSAPYFSRLRVAGGTASVPLLALVFGGHVALGAMALAWVRGAEPRPTPPRPPGHEPAAERLLFVEPAPGQMPTHVERPATGRASTSGPSPQTRPAAMDEHSAAPPTGRMVTAPLVRDTARTSDAAVQASGTDHPAALRGLHPRFGDRRLWTPAESRPLSEAPVAPQSVIDEALAPVVDSVLRERRSAGLAVSDWTASDRRGRSWGLAPSGLRLGRVGLSIQPPELTDRERAQLAARADIARFRHMTPGDAGFDRLKADLRRQRDQARQQRVPPVSR